MLFMKRTLPLIIAFTVGVIGISLYYIPHEGAQQLQETLAQWDRLIWAFAFFLGLYSLLNLHAQRIKRRYSGWAYSVFVYIGFAVMVLSAAWNGGKGPLVGKGTGDLYDWFYLYMFVPSESSMFALLAFFIASAAYRTFRARTTEAAILLIAAVIVMLGRIPIGALIWDQLPDLQQWLMTIPNMAAKRGIVLGVYLGAIATALRIIFGIERSYLGGGE